MAIDAALPVALDFKPTDFGLENPLLAAQRALNLKTQAATADQNAAANAQALVEGQQKITATDQELKDQQILADAMRTPAAAPGGSSAPAGGTGGYDAGGVLMRALQDPRGLSGKAAQALFQQSLKNNETAATAAKDKAQADKDEAETKAKRTAAVFDATGGLLQMKPEDRAAAYPGIRKQMIEGGHVDASELPETYEAWGGDSKLLPTHLAFGTQAQRDTEAAAALKLKADQAEADRKAALAPAQLTTANNEAVTTAPNAAGLTPSQAQDAADKAKALDQKTKNDLAERAEAARRISVEQQRVSREQKQFDATFGQGLDANGRPLSPEDRKNAALSDPTAVAQAAYQIPPPAAGRTTALGKAQWDKILAIDPTYDGTQFAARNKVAQDFSPSGASGKAITSADTALAHLNALSVAGRALDDGDFKALNSIANQFGVQVGQSPKNTYDTIVNMVAPEISKAVIGEAGGEGERQTMAKQFSSDLSTPVREQAIGATAGLLGARVHKQAQAYESQMNKPLARQLSPESQAVLSRYTGGVSAAPSASAPIVQHSPSTGAYRYSTDGGKTWQAGQPK